MRINKIETIIKYSLITMTILILGTAYFMIATAQPSKSPYDSVPVCKGLQMRKDEIKTNPEQFLKEALEAIKSSQIKHQCKIF